MSDIGDILNELATDILPEVFAAAMPDTCSVQGETETRESGGGRYKSATATIASGVPCGYEPIQKFAWKKLQSEQTKATQVYMLTMPTHHNGTRINLLPKHRLIVDARGNEPAITFRIVGIGNDSGVVFEVVVAKEE